MKAIRFVICALVACSVAASAASIEQSLDINVHGWYQLPSVGGPTSQHDRIKEVQFGSAEIVRALAVDRFASDPSSSNYYTGFLILKTPLDGGTNKVVVRQRGSTSEMDVTDSFTFSSNAFVVDQVIQTNVTPPITNSYVERGLKGLSFTTKSRSFTNILSATNICYSLGTTTRSRKFVSPLGTNYCYFLNYSGGSGTFMLNTNSFDKATFQLATNGAPVSGPAQITFRTFGPVITSY
jgi:hypothetical protein